MKLKDIAEIITSGFREKNTFEKKIDIVSSVGLKEDNVFLIEKSISSNQLDTKVMIDDVVIKRVSPQYVNLVNIKNKDAYYGTNLIIIRVDKKKYYPNYIAQLISKNLPMLESLSNSGTRFYSISKKMLESIDIPNVDYDKQKVIGSLWESFNKRNQLLKKTLEKNEILKKIIEERI